MAYGLEIRDASNKITYSTKDITWLVVDKFIVAKNSSAYKTYTGLEGISEIKAQIQLIDMVPNDAEGYSPVVRTGLYYCNVYPDPHGLSERAIITVLAR